MDEVLEKIMLGVRLWCYVGVWLFKNKINGYCEDGVYFKLCKWDLGIFYCNSVRVLVVLGFNSL